ncbi:hypothetical protein PSYMO_37596, partial [Pseudomonas amygdali pv. mori str. 301020]
MTRPDYLIPVPLANKRRRAIHRFDRANNVTICAVF